MNRFLLAGLLCGCALAGQPEPGAGSIEGRVINSLTSAPIRKARVILSATASPIRLVADTDGEGRFQFSALPPGTYRLSASRAGYIEHRARHPISLGANDRVTDAEIRLPPQSVIAGYVLDEDGEAVDRARVHLFKQIYRAGRKLWGGAGGGETNDRGEYRIPNLTAGRYLLQASDERPAIDNRYGDPVKAFYVPAYYPSAPSQQQALPVEVGVGAEVRGVTIHLFKVTRPPSVHVRGKVAGVPADSQIVVSVGLVPADGAFFGGGNTLARPPDYAFDMSVSTGQYLIVGNVYSGGPEAYVTGSISVTGDMSGVVVALRPAPELTGRIVLAESGAKVKLAGVRILLTRFNRFGGGQVTPLRPDAAGHFGSSTPLLPGQYAVDVRSLPDGFFVREMKLAGDEISPDDFEITASGQLEIVLSNTAGKIAGSVTDGDGKPCPGSSVTLIAADGRPWPAKQEADEAGNFQVTHLGPGKYKLFAWEEMDDDLWQDPEFRKKHESRAAEITVGPRETQNVQLRLIGAGEMK